MRSNRSLWTASLACLLWAAPSLAQEGPPPGRDLAPPPGYEEPTQEQLSALIAPSEETVWFRNAKLGIMIHWGPVTLTGVPMSWGRDGPRPGAGRRARDGVPQETYDNLYRSFNPLKFDAEEWLEAIEGSGAGYFVFTTKHHDGFAMWDSDTTEYDIMSSPFRRDIVGELAHAASETPVRTFWYYSQPDWHHPAALQEGHYGEYLPYMRKQLRELLTNYGEVDGIFFDHLASKHYHWDTINLIPELREMQPGLLVNQRIGNRLPEDYQGDYGVYELGIGPRDEERPWESAITLSKAWAWHGGDLTKSPDATLRMFLSVIGNGGNLALNIAPQPDGQIFAGDLEVLAHLGRFNELYGEAVFGTRQGLYEPGPWGTSTMRGDGLYLFVTQQTDNDTISVQLPELPFAPRSIELLTPGQVESRVNDGLELVITPGEHDFPQVVRLLYDQTLENLTPVPTFDPANLVEPVAITASSERSERFSTSVLTAPDDRGVFGEGVHIKSWWEPGANDTAPTITVELENAIPVSSIVLSESVRSFGVDRFRVFYRDDNHYWVPAFHGTTIGMNLGIELDSPPTDAIRVVFDEFEAGSPNITAIDIFATAQR